MAWFKRSKENILTEGQKRDIPSGMWIRCEGCGETLHQKQLEASMYTCPKCDFHLRIGSKEYLNILLDEKSFKELDRKMKSDDPLGFVDTKRYRDRIEDTIDKTGLYDAVRTGTGRINGIDVVVGCMDFNFVGGSMGSVVGEKVARAIDKAYKTRTPLVLISSSGGARMMEGALSLMQMAKTSAKLSRLADAGIPYISIMTDPTTGGVTASYAMLGDINIAEPKALIGFAGPRVIKQATGKDLPEGFQRAEFLLEHGFVDMVVHRKDMKEKVTELLKLLSE